MRCVRHQHDQHQQAHADRAARTAYRHDQTSPDIAVKAILPLQASETHCSQIAMPKSQRLTRGKHWNPRCIPCRASSGLQQPVGETGPAGRPRHRPRTACLPAGCPSTTPSQLLLGKQTARAGSTLLPDTPATFQQPQAMHAKCHSKSWSLSSDCCCWTLLVNYK